MSQLLLHLLGDYVLQSHWMAVNKTKRSWPALVHAVTYSLPFLLLKPSLTAFAVILISHFFIDRYRLARYVVWLKNVILSPTSINLIRFSDSERCSEKGFVGTWLKHFDYQRELEDSKPNAQAYREVDLLLSSVEGIREGKNYAVAESRLVSKHLHGQITREVYWRSLTFLREYFIESTLRLYERRQEEEAREAAREGLANGYTPKKKRAAELFEELKVGATLKDLDEMFPEYVTKPKPEPEVPPHHPLIWPNCKDTGFPSETPVWLSTWLLIIVDNAIHLGINWAALTWL